MKHPSDHERSRIVAVDRAVVGRAEDSVARRVQAGRDRDCSSVQAC